GGVALDQELVKRVFDVRRAVARVENARVVGFVFGEKTIRMAVRDQPPFAVLPVLQLGGDDAVKRRGTADGRTAQIFAPGPGVAEPCGRQQMQYGSFRATVPCGDTYENVFVAGFGIFRENVEVAVFAKDTSVVELEFRFPAAATPIFLDELAVG